MVPYSKHYEDHVIQHFGAEHGERLIALLAGGPDLVFSLIAKHRIGCDASRQGLLFAAHAPSAISTLEKRARFWRERGAPVEMLDRAAAAALIGSDYYPAALLERRGGMLNPLSYARGLGHATAAAGARIFQQSRVIGLARKGSRWQVRTGEGEVEAESVVLATDAYTDELWPGLQQSLVPLRAYNLSTAPLSENVRRSVLPGGQSLTDTRRLYSGIRLRADGRLQVSSGGPSFNNDGRADLRHATERVRALFPQLDELRWDQEVAGWVGMSADQYPHIHSLAPGLWAAVGLSGRGIAFGTLLGSEMAKRITGRPEHELAIPVTPLRPIAIHAVARPLVGALLRWYGLRDRADLSRSR